MVPFVNFRAFSGKETKLVPNPKWREKGIIPTPKKTNTKPIKPKKGPGEASNHTKLDFSVLRHDSDADSDTSSGFVISHYDQISETVINHRKHIWDFSIYDHYGLPPPGPMDYDKISGNVSRDVAPAGLLSEFEFTGLHHPARYCFAQPGQFESLRLLKLTQVWFSLCRIKLPDLIILAMPALILWCDIKDTILECEEDVNFAKDNEISEETLSNLKIAKAYWLSRFLHNGHLNLALPHLFERLGCCLFCSRLFTDSAGDRRWQHTFSHSTSECSKAREASPCILCTDLKNTKEEWTHHPLSCCPRAQEMADAKFFAYDFSFPKASVKPDFSGVLSSVDAEDLIHIFDLSNNLTILDSTRKCPCKVHRPTRLATLKKKSIMVELAKCFSKCKKQEGKMPIDLDDQFF